MRSFYYQRARSAVSAIIMALFAIGAGRVCREDGGVLMFAFAAAMTLGAAKAALDAMNREPALSFDQDSIRVRKTWGGVEEVAWSDVHDINLKAYTVRYMGIIPIRRHTYMTIACEGGSFGARRLRVSMTAMGMSSQQSASVLEMVKQARLQAVGEVRVAMAGAGSRGWGVDMNRSEEGFDADAAMSRYLAAKKEQEPPAARFDTRRSAMPQRPAFGRRIA